MHSTKPLFTLLFLGATVTSSAALIEDFEGVDPLSDWHNGPGWSVVADPTDAGNNVLEAFGRSGNQVAGSSATIGSADTDILEFRFYLTANTSNTDLSIGMAETVDLSGLSNSNSSFFGPMLRLEGDQSSILRLYEGNGSGGGSFNAADQILVAETWYTVQMTIDNDADTWSGTISGGAFVTPTTLTYGGSDDTFGYRTNGTGSLANFAIRANTSNNNLSRGAYLDDIAIVPEPSTFAVFGFAGIAALLILRRRK